MTNYDPLFYWVVEREKIRVAKDMGLPFPWSADQILNTYRFCNVRREDDRGTVWIRNHVRNIYAGHPMLWLMLCICRQVNWPDTLARLIADRAWPDHVHFHPIMMTVSLNARKARGEKVYTGAYMISTPSVKGSDKQSYIAETVIGALWNERNRFCTLFQSKPSLQETHRSITEFNGWGQFMAYQAVVDMRFTGLLDSADDRYSWAAAGPGTLRGLNRVHGRDKDAALSQGQALTEMRAIYKVVQQETGVAMDFSDVPNILCETDKYLREKNGEGHPRALFVQGRGA